MPAEPYWQPSAPDLVEEPTSGKYNLGDQQSLVKSYTGKYDDCVEAALVKGTLGSGDLDGYRVQSSEVTKSRGEVGRLVIVWELIAWGGEVLPADEWGLTPSDLNPAVERNPAFNGVTAEQHEKARAAVFTGDEASAKVARQWIEALASDSGGPNDRTKLLRNLLERGITNYYKPYFVYWWREYFITEPGVNTGGYREAPGGPLGSAIASLELECLRKADNLEFNNGLYIRTRSWLCFEGDEGSVWWHALLYPSA